jgi:hypothetical protein
VRLRRSLLVFAVLLLPLTAHADSHKAGIRAAAAFGTDGALAGVSTSLEFPPSVLKKNSLTSSSMDDAAQRTVPTKGDHHAPFNFVVDFEARFISSDDTDVTSMIGVRWSWRVAQDVQGTKVMLFAQVLGGATRVTHELAGKTRVDNVWTTTTFGAFAPGGGIDFLPWTKNHTGLRLQGDWLKAWAGPRSSYARLSIGFVHRWPAD